RRQRDRLQGPRERLEPHRFRKGGEIEQVRGADHRFEARRRRGEPKLLRQARILGDLRGELGDLGELGNIRDESLVVHYCPATAAISRACRSFSSRTTWRIRSIASGLASPLISTLMVVSPVRI